MEKQPEGFLAPEWLKINRSGVLCFIATNRCFIRQRPDVYHDLGAAKKLYLILSSLKYVYSNKWF